ncbi:hypothetical protein [Caldisericum exile]|uniref:Hypothetical membrane protein n=1 Tax=Caldisericum exile (strain DSM 21853 / NBRC 104410 / AZM16c01) TaxID=511051 RepID=A0A7U6GG22_CALEA|nr:hypothetical protein [Caldisericum exile]BAL81701.1 hypothetical membrane protein [Caldisericum exile AZM16c01]
MDWLLIVLEYSVFTVPIGIGFWLSFRWFVQKRTYERVLFIVSFLLPVTSVLSLIKVFYILELGPKEPAFLPVNFIFALGIVLSVYIVIFLTTGKYVAIPNKIEIIGIGFLIISSFFIQNKIRIFDYVSWGLIGIAVIHLARGFAYSTYGSKREKRIYVFVVIFSSISILLKLLFYLSLISLKPAIYISLTLMFLSFLHATFVMRDIGAKMPSRPLEKQVFNEKVSIFRRLIVVSLIATLIMSISTVFGYNSYKTQKDNIISNLQDKIQNAAFTITDKLNIYLVDSFENYLTYLAQTLEVDNISKAKSQIKTFYETHKDTFASVTLMNNKGVIVYTYPYTYSIGINIANQPHVKEALETKKVTPDFITYSSFLSIFI